MKKTLTLITTILCFLLLSSHLTATALNPDQARAEYEKAFGLLELDLSEKEAKILYEESDGRMSAETKTRIKEGLEILTHAASAEKVHWNKEEIPDEIFPLLPHVGAARNAARMGTWYLKENGGKNPDQALELFETLSKTADHLNKGSFLIEMLTSMAIEGIAHTAIQEIAGEWEPQHRKRLIEIVQNTAPDFSAKESLAREGNHLLSKMRNALFSTSEETPLAAQIRISSVVILPGKTSIGIEHLHRGINFTLEPGQTKHDIELVEFNPKEDFAIIRSKGEEAIIHLQSRETEPIFPKKFFRLVGIESDGNVAQELIKENDQFFSFPSLRDRLDGDESDAEVALILLNEMEKVYQLTNQFMAEPIGGLSTDYDNRKELELPEGMSAFSAGLFQAFLKTRRLETKGKTSRDMLVSALKLIDDPNSPLPVDRFSPEGDKLKASINPDAIEISSVGGSGGEKPFSYRIKLK